MNEQAMLKQMEAEEKLAEEEVSKEITAYLNSPSTKKEADRINQQSGGWPYPPSREMLALYQRVADKAWKAMKGAYKHLDIKVNIQPGDGKREPSAQAEAKYRGAFRGGKSLMLKPGDTIVSIARSEYGYDAYASILWEANEHILGPQCRVIPAGFGIEVPRIFVPEWSKPPKASVPPGAASKAVKILNPCLEFDLQPKKSGSYTVELGAFTIIVTLKVAGKFKAQKTGTIDANFNLRSYEAEVTRDLGPLSGGYKFNLKEGKGKFDLSVSNSGLPGVNMSTKVDLRAGKPNITFGTKKVSFTYKGIVFEGNLELSADVQIIPKRVPEEAPRSSPLANVNWKAVGAFAIVGVIVVGGVLAGVPTGGTATAAAAGAAVVVLSTVGTSA